MGWLSFISNKFAQKGDETMSENENVLTPEVNATEAVVEAATTEAITADIVTNEPVAPDTPTPDAASPSPQCECQQGSCVSPFTAELQTLEGDIASLEADLLKKLAQKKSILLGENAKVDLDLSVLGTLK